MFKLTTALDRSMYVIKIAKDKLKIDGLVPAQISQVLWHTFRLNVTQPAIGMALMKSVKYIHRKQIKTKGGKRFVYLLMHEGETYLGNKLYEIQRNDKKTK